MADLFDVAIDRVNREKKNGPTETLVERIHHLNAEN